MEHFNVFMFNSTFNFIKKNHVSIVPVSIFLMCIGTYIYLCLFVNICDSTLLYHCHGEGLMCLAKSQEFQEISSCFVFIPDNGYQ